MNRFCILYVCLIKIIIIIVTHAFLFNFYYKLLRKFFLNEVTYKKMYYFHLTIFILKMYHENST